jgi:polar amino acid transport system substrate-binding protein
VRGRLLFPLLLLGAAFSAARAADDVIVIAATETAYRQYVEDGQPVGYLPDLLTEAFRRAGYTVKIRLMPWARCLAEAKAGTIDGVFDATRTPEREGYLQFADEVLVMEIQSAFVRADDSAGYSTSVEGLADIRLGLIYASSTGEEIDRAIAEKRLHHVDYASNYESLLHMLTGRRVDMIVADRLSIQGTASKEGLLGDLRELPRPVLTDPIYVAFTRARDMSTVSRDFSAGLRSMKQDGTYFAIFAKYFR